MYKISAALFSVMVLSIACTPPASEPYARVKHEDFLVASKTFKSIDNKGPKVTLLGAIHLGEESYYAEIQKRLDRADRVLFESVGTSAENQEIQREIEKNCPHHLVSPASPFDIKSMAKILDLKEQMDLINYNRPHFVHADMSLAEFIGPKYKKGASICKMIDDRKQQYSQIAQKMDKEIEPFKKLGPTTTRNILALVLAKVIGPKRDTANEDAKKILFDRNDIVLKTLRKELPLFSSGQEIVIFYGAMHMEDLENALLEMNYELVNTEWLKAISL